MFAWQAVSAEESRGKRRRTGEVPKAHSDVDGPLEIDGDECINDLVTDTGGGRIAAHPDNEVVVSELTLLFEYYGTSKVDGASFKRKQIA